MTTKHDAIAEAEKLFDAQADRWESEGVDPRDIFHTYAQAFGRALSRYCEPPVAVAFLRQEIGRIERLHAAGKSETVQ